MFSSLTIHMVLLSFRSNVIIPQLRRSIIYIEIPRTETPDPFLARSNGSLMVHLDHKQHEFLYGPGQHPCHYRNKIVNSGGFVLQFCNHIHGVPPRARYDLGHGQYSFETQWYHYLYAYFKKCVEISLHIFYLIHLHHQNDYLLTIPILLNQL